MNRTPAGKRQRALVIGVSLVGAAAIGAAVDRLAFAQQPGIKRTILLRTDEPGSQTHEAVMGVAEIAPGAMAGKHRLTGATLSVSPCAPGAADTAAPGASAGATGSH
jgi:hypothetical protein